MMKRAATILPLIILLLTGLRGHAAAELTDSLFVDSITGVTLRLDAPSLITNIDPTGYKKCAIITSSASVIGVYSVVNPRNEPYTWKKLNEFDSSYGTPRSKQRLNDVDGWMRLYDTKSSDGTPLVRLVTLVRAKNYAFYLDEVALADSLLRTPDIVPASTFPGKISGNYGPRKPTEAFSLNITLFYIIALACLIGLRFLRNRFSTWVKVAIIIVFAAAAFIVAFFIDRYQFVPSFGALILTGFVAWALLTMSTWDQVLDQLDKIFKNL